MGDSYTPGPSSSSPPLSTKTNLPMLYYGLVVVGTAAIVLAIYNVIVIWWCTQCHDDSNRRRTRLTELVASRSCENQTRNFLLSSFKYKGSIKMGSEDGGGDYECAVCLSVFEDGDEVKQLPRCKHSFHAPCIDMWLYSHLDCPLCRTSVDTQPSTIRQREREGFPGIPVLV